MHETKTPGPIQVPPSPPPYKYIGGSSTFKSPQHGSLRTDPGGCGLATPMAASTGRRDRRVTRRTPPCGAQGGAVHVVVWHKAAPPQTLAAAAGCCGVLMHPQRASRGVGRLCPTQLWPHALCNCKCEIRIAVIARRSAPATGIPGAQRRALWLYGYHRVLYSGVTVTGARGRCGSASVQRRRTSEYHRVSPRATPAWTNVQQPRCDYQRNGKSKANILQPWIVKPMYIAAPGQLQPARDTEEHDVAGCNNGT